jgi:hypothetical protein
MCSFRKEISILAAALTLAGCSLRARKPVAAAAPPPVRPAVGAAPPPAVEPLSIPQTQVMLPPPQAVSEEALATIQEPVLVELPEPPSPPPARRVTASSPPPGPKPETLPAAQGPAAPASPAPAAVEPERPRIQELVSPAEQKLLADSLEARRREIRMALDQATARGPSSSEKDLMNRIRSFLKLSDEALARGDARQADAQAERAQILCRELHGAR